MVGCPATQRGALEARRVTQGNRLAPSEKDGEENGSVGVGEGFQFLLNVLMEGDAPLLIAIDETQGMDTMAELPAEKRRM